MGQTLQNLGLIVPGVGDLYGVGSGEIQPGAVNNAALGALAVTAAKIAANTITDAKIAANTITNASIAANTIGSSQIDPATLQHASVVLTAVQICAMNGAPVQLLAAPGAGKSIVLCGPVLLRYTQATSNLASGGAVVIQYHTGPIAATGTTAATQFTGASSESVTVPIAALPTINDAIEITNATGAFTKTTATGTLTVDFDYRII